MSEKHPEGQFEVAGSLDERAVDRIESLCRRAGVLMTVRCKVEMGHVGHSFHEDEKMMSMSLGKLPLARMVIDRLDPTEVHHVDPTNAIGGGGYYDRSGVDEHAPTHRLLEDMLKNSGNTAYRLLAAAVGGPDEMNEYYAEHGWSSTSVFKSHGRAATGLTTVGDSLRQMQSVINPDDTSELAEVARQSLRFNCVESHGIRQIIQNSDHVKIYNKTGEFNGDKTDPHAFRHDVGLVVGPKGAAWYAIMTSSPMFMRGRLADMVVGQFGAEIAHAVGGHDKFALGRQAVRAS